MPPTARYDADVTDDNDKENKITDTFSIILEEPLKTQWEWGKILHTGLIMSYSRSKNYHGPECNQTIINFSPWCITSCFLYFFKISATNSFKLYFNMLYCSYLLKMYKTCPVMAV